jgi:hypothetical protein
MSMPSDFTEDVHFDRSISRTGVCLSTYQTQLNMIYQIASPVLENIWDSYFKRSPTPLTVVTHDLRC